MEHGERFFGRPFSVVDGGFCDRGGPRDTVDSGNVGMIVPIRTANGTLFWGISGECSSGKMFQIEVL